MTAYPTAVQVEHKVTDPDTVYELLSVLEQDGTIVPGMLSEPWVVSETFAILNITDSIHIGYSIHEDEMELTYIPDPTMATAKVIFLSLNRSISDTALLTITSQGREEDGEMVLFVTNLVMMASERLDRFYGRVMVWEE